MNNTTLMVIIVCGAFIIVGMITFLKNLYSVVVIDATSRGMRRVAFWGILSLSGNNSSGLLLYLIKRRNYPIIELSEKCEKEKERRKQTLKVAIFFMILPLLLLLYVLTMTQ